MLEFFVFIIQIYVNILKIVRLFAIFMKEGIVIKNLLKCNKKSCAIFLVLFALTWIITLATFISAENEGQKTVLDITKGSITINSTGIIGKNPYGNEVTEVNPYGYTIVGNGVVTTNTISVNTYTTVELNNVQIDSGDVTPFSLSNGIVVDVYLIGENKFGTSWDGVSTTNIVVGNDTIMYISGTGSLFCAENMHSSKLQIGSAGGVVIKSGTVTLQTTPHPVII